MSRLERRITELERKAGLGAESQVLFVEFVTPEGCPPFVTATILGADKKLVREAGEDEEQFRVRCRCVALEGCGPGSIAVVLLGGPEPST